MKGKISNIERYAINDGFGVRTTVFLKGCPLRCRWCSNPETQEYYPEMVFFKDKCIGCGTCVKACQYGALAGGLEADREICRSCWQREKPFACTQGCYPQCRKVSGEDYTVDQVVQIAKRDMSFYQRSGGGVTISGGEPLAQPEFLYQLLKALKASWIDTAIETCLAGKPEDIERIAPYLDFAFVDFKSADTDRHKEWIGAGNEQILENLELIDRLAKQHDFPLIIRTPVIPGFNDREEDIEQIAAFVSKHCRNYQGMELLPYHKLGRGKYTSLGRDYPLAELDALPEQRINELNRVLDRYQIAVYKF